MSFRLAILLLPLAVAFGEDICQTCSCKAKANAQIYTINCANKSLDHTLTTWPPQNNTIIANFAGNNLRTLEPLPPTNASVEIILSRCNIKYLQAALFAASPNVKFVDLSYNQLPAEEIASEKFRGPINNTEYRPIAVENLNLAYNQIHSLGMNVFEHMPNLKILNLEGNDFTMLDIHTQLALTSVRQLQSLNLANNELTEMIAGAIQTHKNLTELNLSNNLLDFVPSSLAQIGQSLQILNLDNNPKKPSNELSSLQNSNYCLKVLKPQTMELLTPHLSSVRVPTATSKVYKDECVFSFDNPETETGLYVGLKSFFGLGRDYVEKHFHKTGEAVYLHIRRVRHEVSSPPQGDGPEKKITRLAIGVDGGFDPEAMSKKFEFEDSYNIVVLPGFSTIPWPNTELPQIVKSSIEGILEAPSASKVAEMEALTGTWDGEARVVSQFAHNLPQLDNGKKIPPSGWQCEKCDKTDNLWLNLTDGSILCGRRFYDGSGGNNHAIEHYNATGHPLAVKLGTITKEGKGDVFSYKEDDMVEDPNLVQHLAHWGINIANMEKTEKSMVELELELNQKSNEWSALQESDGQLKPIYGPGYTGMTNMGNSCYLNSVMQMVFSIPDFIQRYYHDAELFFNNVVGDPCEDFNAQMAKLGVGLHSGKYSVPPPAGSPVDADPPGICPLMFKALVGRGHPEFSTKKQQDAQEFFLHILTLLERNSKNKVNPGDCFKFKVEEKFQCSASKKVKYLTRSDVLLPLIIPMDAAINKDEVAAYETKKLEAEKTGKKLLANTIVRPKINFLSCLELFTQSEVINNFYSSAVNANVTARKTTRLATFPDYLCIQLKKFMLREDWVPIKLDVSIEMPDILDISSLRGTGPQSDEELLPEPKVQPPAPVMDEGVLAQLADMGFPPEACKRAVFFTHNSGLEAATAWIMEHITDSDFSDPFVPPGTESSHFTPNAEALASIVAMGFTQHQATKALKATDNNVERAMDWIFSHQDELDNVTSPPPPEFRDGDGRYKLVAFVSHMGTSTMVGHYVVHILKNGQWVIFNDNKVALSERPPKDLGYMYLYERL